MTRPRPPKPKFKTGPPKRGSRRTQFKTLPGGTGDLLEDDLRVLDWVTRYVGTMGYPPLISELVAAFGLSSRSLGFSVLRRLSAFGFLDVDDGVARGIRLTSLPPLEDLGANRVRLWLGEAAALIRRWAPEDDPEAAAFLKKISSVSY